MTNKLLFWEKATEFEKRATATKKNTVIEKNTDYLADKARELQAENQKLRNYIVKAMDYLEKAANKQGNPWKEAKMMRDAKADKE